MEIIRTKLKQYPELSALLIFILGGIAVTYFTNHFFVALSPFIIAYVVARLLHPIMVKIRRIIKIPNILNALLCMIAFIVVAGGIMWMVGSYLLDGVTYIIDLLSAGETIDKIVSNVQYIGTKIDDFAKFINVDMSVDDMYDVVGDFAKNAISVLSNFSINLAMQVPTLIMSFVIGCVAAFYMLTDYDNIAHAIMKQLSPTIQRFVNVFHAQALSSFIKMIMSYVLISAICFCELLIGFVILNIEDASFIALLIAILDVLPVVGSGAILIPWGIVCCLTGRPICGVGLLILYAIIMIIRQIIEPRIVGSQIGLHPLVTVASLYLGLKFMGGLGLIMGPLYVIVCKKLNEEGLIQFYKIAPSSQQDNTPLKNRLWTRKRKKKNK
jgi:sporulation integral membrane protein YtvI